MTDTPIPAENESHWARPLFERQIDRLDKIADCGVEIVEHNTKLAKDAWCVEGAHTAALSHARLARSVRLTLMLQDRLIKDLIAFDKGVAHDKAWTRTEQTRDRKDLAGNVIARVIARKHPDDRQEVERLLSETTERLDREDLYGSVLSRPVSELVAIICRDLGLDPDWPRLAGEGWAKDEAAGGDVGWPLAGMAIDGKPAGASFETPLRRSSG